MWQKAPLFTGSSVASRHGIGIYDPNPSKLLIDIGLGL